MTHAAAERLEAEKARVDALNVFPVADGDTGTNMALTLRAAAEAVLSPLTVTHWASWRNLQPRVP